MCISACQHSHCGNFFLYLVIFFLLWLCLLSSLMQLVESLPTIGFVFLSAL